MSTTQRDTLVSEFGAIVSHDNSMTSEVDLHAYSYDAAVLHTAIPGYVVRLTSVDRLGRINALCNTNGLPLIVREAGTNLCQTRGGTLC